MLSLRKNCSRFVLSRNPFICIYNQSNPLPSPSKHYITVCYLNPIDTKLKFEHLLTTNWTNPSSVVTSNGFMCLYSLYSTRTSSRLRSKKKSKFNSKPAVDQAHLECVKSLLPPRFSPEELCIVISEQEDPILCFELFNWASQQPRFRHDVSSYHVTIKKLGAAKMYEEMDDVVNQVLAVRHIGSEALYNSIIYYLTEARKLTRAVNIFNHMKNCRNLDSRPSSRTYNILFAAFLSRRSNSYINRVYMETSRCLFRQMVSDGIEPDTFTLNCMIKGYVLSLHVNDALRIFHQMGVVYNCRPNSFSYNYLIHGLCAQGRTNNARELCREMKKKGFVPSNMSYNSLVNALALDGEVDEAVDYLSEMIENQRSADIITYRTVLDEMCRRGRVQEATVLLEKVQEKKLVDGHTYMKLLSVIEGNFGNTTERNRFSVQDVGNREEYYREKSGSGTSR